MNGCLSFSKQWHYNLKLSQPHGPKVSAISQAISTQWQWQMQQKIHRQTCRLIIRPHKKPTLYLEYWLLSSQILTLYLLACLLLYCLLHFSNSPVVSPFKVLVSYMHLQKKSASPTLQNSTTFYFLFFDFLLQ